MEQVIADFAGAAYGSAGERCMALPVAVPVSQKTADEFVERMMAEIGKLKVGLSTDSEAHGPVVSAAHQRIEDYVAMGVQEGAAGRWPWGACKAMRVFIGPSLFDNVRPDMQSYRESIQAGIKLSVPTRWKAARLPSEHQYGNGVAIFTRNGLAQESLRPR